MTLPNLVSSPHHTRQEISTQRPTFLFMQLSAAMANVNFTAEVAQTASKEQDVKGEVEATEENGANGQLPDSKYIEYLTCVQ